MGDGSMPLVWLGAVLIAALLAAAIWVATPARPKAEALDALVPDAKMAVLLKPWIAFLPAERRRTGMILYPGARVDPRVYARVARAIAEHGYLTLITPMPLNLALMAPGSASRAMQDFTGIQSWVVAGHSLGGVAAAHYARRHRSQAAALLLWAAIPFRFDDLSEATIPVTSIYATEDGLVTPEAVLRSRGRLPPDTHFVEIVGGNHAQFGRYPPQLGSRPAAISPDQQQDQIVQATLALLSAVDDSQR